MVCTVRLREAFSLEGDEWKYSEEERKQANETFKGLSITHQMLVFLHGSMITVGETYDYSGRYAKEKADKLLKGWQPSNCLGGSLRWMRRSKFWTEQVSYLHLRKKSKLLTLPTGAK